MFQYDFSNHQNRHIRIMDMPAEYFQRIQETTRNDPYYPVWHIAPKCGLMNDPNGLCEINGIHHIFYQWFPAGPVHGLKHWYHLTTKDFIHYEDFGPVVFPDEDIDAHGVYSGSAFIEDDTIHYFYTGNLKYFDRDDYDYINNGRGSNTITFTSKDGYEFTKKELLMTTDDYPADMSNHVRDPKIFKKNEKYYMVLGARDVEGVGMILLYESTDLKNWTYKNRITTPQKFGYMWECPDLFEMDGQLYIICCPQGVETQGIDYENVHQVTAMKLDYDFDTDEYEITDIKLFDRGFDFYAPQSFETEDGRRVHISWMGMPDCKEYTNLTIAEGWQHCFTFPREVFVKDGKVCQRPVRELQKRKTLVDKSAGMLKKDGYKVYDVNISGIQNNEFRTVIDEELILEYKNGRFEMHFTSQDKNSVSAGRGMRYVDVDKISSVEILVDKSSVEVFVNNGEYVFTTRFYPQKDSLAVEAAGAEIMMEEIR